MIVINTEKIEHKGRIRITLKCPDIEALNSIAQKLPECCFSRSLKCWNIPASKIAYEALMKHQGSSVIYGYYYSDPNKKSYFIEVNKWAIQKGKINISFLGSRQLLVNLPSKNEEWFTFFKNLNGFLWHPEYLFLLVDASDKNISLIKNEFRNEVAFRFDNSKKQIKPVLTIATLKKWPETVLLFTSDNEIIEKISFIKTARKHDLFRFYSIANNQNLIYSLIESVKDFALIDISRYKPNDQVNNVSLQTETEPLIYKKQTGIRSINLSSDKEDALRKYREWLEVKRYSTRTIELYIDCMKLFLVYFADRDLKEINNSDFLLFNKKVIIDEKYSASYQNQSINAIKLFFDRIENTDLRIEEIERPKRPKKLPNVISKQEVEMLLKSIRNIKHKTILTLIYSCGLRRSELVNLEVPQLNKERKVLEILNSKGKKDRLIPLSKKLQQFLDLYLSKYQPKKYLFEGNVEGEKLSFTSLWNILKFACIKVGITKPVSLHWLRHSYATHLHEGGTDIRVIQELLGHKSCRTTEIYTHVSTKYLHEVFSPIDDMDI